MKYDVSDLAISDITAVDIAKTVEYGSNQPVEIEGIVSARGQGGSPHRGAPYGVHIFSLDAWRVAGMPLRESELTVLRPVAAGADPFGVVSAGDLLRLRVRLDTQETRSVLLSMETLTTPDHALAEAAERLAKPVLLQSERFGTLQQNKSIGWFEGTAAWCGASIRLTVDDAEAGLATAEALWSDELGWKDRVDAFAVAKLLELKNGTWLDDDEEPISAEEFVGRMRLTSIGVDAEGHFSFWHDDGDLFWGHSIEIRGTLAKGPSHADIPG